MSWFRKKTTAKITPKTTGEWNPQQFETYEKQLLEMNKQYLQERNDCLAKLIPDALETFWNDKRPKSDLTYGARPVYGSGNNIEVDPRIFYTNDKMPVIAGLTDDDKALNSLNYVIANIVYTSDTTQFKDSEMWMFAFETLNTKKGDCEDGAILLANLMLKSGIPYWRIRLNAGDVQGGGHCWVTYLRESDNTWYILDWCYWANESQNFGRTFKDAQKYFDIWFSWNVKYIYQDENFERTGIKLKTGNTNNTATTRGKSNSKA